MSSKLRTQSDIEDAMSQEFAWRKMELSSFKSMVIDDGSLRKQDTRIRAAVLMLYAHWEGFIKKIGDIYLQFVSLQQLKHKELAAPILGIIIHSMVHEAGQSSKIKPSLELVEFFRSESETRSNMAWKSAIHTKSNLNSDVLREIVMQLGLDYSRFETKEKLIDDVLVHYRNNIAHGKELTMDRDGYLALHDEVFGMMQDFYNQIDNSVANMSYRL